MHFEYSLLQLILTDLLGGIIVWEIHDIRDAPITRESVMNDNLGRRIIMVVAVSLINGIKGYVYPKTILCHYQQMVLQTFTVLNRTDEYDSVLIRDFE